MRRPYTGRRSAGLHRDDSKSSCLSFPEPSRQDNETNYENLDLSKDDDLKKACEAVRENNPKWRAKVVSFLKDVQEADEETAPV